MSRVSDDFDRFAEAKLQALQQTLFQELSELDGTVYYWSSRRRRGTVAVAIEHVDNDTLRVIVQGFLPSRFLPSLKNTFVDGFRKMRDGRVVRMAYEVVSGYD